MESVVSYKLGKAAKNGDINKVKYLIKKYANNKDYKNCKALYYACRSGNIEIAKLLLENISDIDWYNKEYLVLVSCENNHIEMLKLLLECNFPACVDSLINAVVDGDTEIVKILLKNGANPNSYYSYIDKNEDLNDEYRLSYKVPPCVNNCALLHACEEGRTEIVELLIEYGADINFNTDKNKEIYHFEIEELTPIMKASHNDNNEIVLLLLNKGADIKNYGDKLLFNAVNNGSIEIIKILLERGVDIKKCCDRLLLNAVKNGHLEIIKLLLECGADIKKCCEGLLLNAVKNDNLEIIKLLLECGADHKLLKEDTMKKILEDKDFCMKNPHLNDISS